MNIKPGRLLGWLGAVPAVLVFTPGVASPQSHTHQAKTPQERLVDGLSESHKQELSGLLNKAYGAPEVKIIMPKWLKGAQRQEFSLLIQEANRTNPRPLSRQQQEDYKALMDHTSKLYSSKKNNNSIRTEHDRLLAKAATVIRQGKNVGEVLSPRERTRLAVTGYLLQRPHMSPRDAEALADFDLKRESGKSLSSNETNQEEQIRSKYQLSKDD